MEVFIVYFKVDRETMKIIMCMSVALKHEIAYNAMLHPMKSRNQAKYGFIF
jgi:hypothetical protein